MEGKKKMPKYIFLLESTIELNIYRKGLNCLVTKRTPKLKLFPFNVYIKLSYLHFLSI